VSPEVTQPRHSIWENVSHFLAKRQIGPIDYVARQFDKYASLMNPLFPTNLLGEAAWKRYTDSKATKLTDIAQRLHGDLSKLHSPAYSCGIDWQERPGRDITVEERLSVLYCDSSLSPLFIFCAGMLLARQHPAYADEAAGRARRYEVEAAVEYIRFRADYDTVLRPFLPEGFRARAEGIYREILSQVL